MAQERNFLRDQSGMRAQLLTLDQLVQLMDPKLYLHLQSADSTNFFFFFRMLLVWYKREFEWLDVLHLWEVLWTDYLTSSFHLFVALAILEKHRDVIMQHLSHFDEVLKYGMCSKSQNVFELTNVNIVNELSNSIDLGSTLTRAESLFRRFQRTVETIDKKHNFPSPTVRQRKSISEATAGSSASASGIESSNATGSTSAAVSKGVGTDEEKVISPELRSLLSRKVITVDKAKHESGK
jgi:hypothetical protein